MCSFPTLSLPPSLASLQSITVTLFEGYNEEGTVDVSPLRRANMSSEGGEIYSCGGSVAIGWSHTGLLEEVDVRVSYFCAAAVAV